ncbi:aldo/keto reductase, diketogulonate reductase [Rivularia sp. PCC 7116]|uniref:aldo/keto reductase n=1 Tax=Rivularia sp. PCC 7116 TaxID=373994 RepID=UPI00029EDE3E|nr:aldo/keto reductase [Rivularia sp. PCC 7116]AFY57715.1 aldo/keto reductase, diketogulonate reductase [Rivularia sp. PCC 7116]
MKTIHLSSGIEIPALGQGTWRMGEDSSQKDAEIAALRLGLDMGMTLIDTAEMYGEGGAEEVVGEAIKNRRQEVYLVSKVYPHNASLKGAIAACERSLKRLKTDCIDLYLLHWRSSIPLSETLEAFESLKQAGKIRDYGVSNFDADEMKKAIKLPYGNQIATNQVLYNLARRGIEWDLLPWSRQHNIPIMAYSPIEQKGILKNSQLKSVASRHNATPAQVGLAWLLQQEGIIAIPKASNPEHVKENSVALDIQLTQEDLTELDKAFPPPNRKMSLAIR